MILAEPDMIYMLGPGAEATACAVHGDSMWESPWMKLLPGTGSGMIYNRCKHQIVLDDIDYLVMRRASGISSRTVPAQQAED